MAAAPAGVRGLTTPAAVRRVSLNGLRIRHGRLASSPCLESTMRTLRIRAIVPSVLALSAALAAAACSTPGQPPPPAPTGDIAIEGTVVSVDTRPWTYDGHAVVKVDVPGRGPVSVQLPAR